MVNPKKKSARHVWVPLVVGGKLNGEIKRAIDRTSGAYAIRTKRGHGVVYVGESHVGRMWRTLMRHFQSDAFRSDLPRFKRPEDYEVTWQVTSRGARSKDNIDAHAKELESEWIAKWGKQGAREPLKNIAGNDPDASFDFGANVEPEGAFDSLLNPAASPVGRLVELGILTRLGVGRAVLLWTLRDAPILAYDAAKTRRLFIVYVGGVVAPSSAEDLKEYRRTHWGQSGKGDVRRGGIAPPPFVDLGPATSITYTTRKGFDRELVDYVHPFGEGSSRRCIFPRVLRHACAGGCSSKCAARGALRLEGGSYTVEARGIVG